MTWLDGLLYGPGLLTLLVCAADWWADRRFRRRYAERWGVPYDGP